MPWDWGQQIETKHFENKKYPIQQFSLSLSVRNVQLAFRMDFAFFFSPVWHLQQFFPLQDFFSFALVSNGWNWIQKCKFMIVNNHNWKIKKSLKKNDLTFAWLIIWTNDTWQVFLNIMNHSSSWSNQFSWLFHLFFENPLDWNFFFRNGNL